MEKFSAEKRFNELRKVFEKEARHLISVIELYKHIHEKKADSLDEINIAPSFFGYALASFFTTIIIWTHKLLNVEKPKEFSIHKFLNFVEQNIGIFSKESFKKRTGFADEHWIFENWKPLTVEVIKSDRKKIKKLECLKCIKDRRNQFHAHFNKEYVANPKLLKKEAPLIWNDLDKIREVVSDIYNRYSSSFDGNMQEFKAVNLFDIDEVFDILYQYNKEIKKTDN